MKINEISLVIPVYNEQDNLQPLIEEIHTALHKHFSFEIIVVDDGSQDNSKNILSNLVKEHSYLRAIFHSKNLGQSTSISTGVAAARYSWVITLDGDGQNDPTDIPELIQQLEKNIHHSVTKQVVLVGNRKKRNDTWIRRMSTRIANGIRRRLLNDNCPDTGCSLKIFQRDAFLRLPHFNHMHRFLPALFKRAQFEVVNFPVNHRPRLRGQSKYGLNNRLWVGIIDLFGVMWLIRRPCYTQHQLVSTIKENHTTQNLAQSEKALELEHE